MEWDLHAAAAGSKNEKNWVKKLVMIGWSHANRDAEPKNRLLSRAIVTGWWSDNANRSRTSYHSTEVRLFPMSTLVITRWLSSLLGLEMQRTFYTNFLTNGVAQQSVAFWSTVYIRWRWREIRSTASWRHRPIWTEDGVHAIKFVDEYISEIFTKICINALQNNAAIR